MHSMQSCFGQFLRIFLPYFSHSSPIRVCYPLVIVLCILHYWHHVAYLIIEIMSRFAEKSCTRLTYWLRKWLHIRLVSIVQVCVNVFAHVCVCVYHSTRISNSIVYYLMHFHRNIVAFAIFGPLFDRFVLLIGCICYISNDNERIQCISRMQCASIANEHTKKR